MTASRLIFLKRAKIYPIPMTEKTGRTTDKTLMIGIIGSERCVWKDVRKKAGPPKRPGS